MIKNLELVNFKGFSDLSVRLKNLTVIAGQNGAGKSSLIQSLLLLRQSYQGKVEDFTPQFIFEGKLADLRNAFAVHTKNGDERNTRISIDDDALDDEFWAEFPSREEKVVVNGVLSENYREALEKASLFAPSFVYLYANRMVPLPFYRKEQDHYTDSRIGDKTGHLTGFLLQKLLDEKTELAVQGLQFQAEIPRVSDNVSEWVSYVMGQKVAVQPKGRENDNEIELSYIQDGERISPVNMAFGDTYVLPVIVAVMTAPKGSLIILENPEAHLHPSAQLRLGELLAKAAQGGIQVIVETHSDHLLNGVRVAAKRNEIKADNVAIHYVWQDGDGHYDSDIELLQDGTLDSWPKGFFDEWEQALRDINA